MGTEDEKVTPWGIGRLYTVIPGRLSFSVHLNDEMTIDKIKAHPDLFFFSSYCQDEYTPFCRDFGPVNLGVVHRFCQYMRDKLNHPQLKNRHLVYYSEVDASLRTNTAFLLSAFLLIDYNMSPEDATRPFMRITPSPFPAYRDASYAKSQYDLPFKSCIEGLHRAIQAGWYCPTTFDMEEYETMYDPEVDINVICSKFLAFRGPSSGNVAIGDSEAVLPASPPSLYVKTFQALDVRLVVRLNAPDAYDAEEAFVSRGIEHADLEFADCSAPSDELLERFLDLVDAHRDGMVAVHCLAGLGRTGTLIAAWAMKHYKMSAAQAIGWLRLCRPGSVIGPQQLFLEALNGAKWERNRPLRADQPAVQISQHDAEAAREMAVQFEEAAALRFEETQAARNAA